MSAKDENKDDEFEYNEEDEKNAGSDAKSAKSEYDGAEEDAEDAEKESVDKEKEDDKEDNDDKNNKDKSDDADDEAYDDIDLSGPRRKSIPLPSDGPLKGPLKEAIAVHDETHEEDHEEGHDKGSSKKDSGKPEEGEKQTTHIYALRTTANREDQVMDFLASNITKRKLDVYSVIRPHGMRGYIFVETEKRSDAEQAGFNIPYARGVLKNEINYHEIEHMLEQVKKEHNIKKNDIAEIIAGPFKREKCKIMRIDKTKEEVVVELLEAAVPIPITLKVDALKVIRRDDAEQGDEEDTENDDE